MDDGARAPLDELVGRLADGDRGAFEPAYAILWPIVRAFCGRALAPSAADDAAQSALLKVFERAATFDPERPALPWVLAIAAWECRTVRRRAFRRREVPDDAIAAAPSARSSPEHDAIEADLKQALREVLAALPEADRLTLEGSMADGAPPAVAATTFRKRRERAIERLKAAWRRAYGD